MRLGRKVAGRSDPRPAWRPALRARASTSLERTSALESSPKARQVALYIETTQSDVWMLQEFYSMVPLFAGTSLSLS